MDLAPIILFVYNRPWHTEQVLLSLRRNEFAQESTLYIYSDGPKDDASKKDIVNILKTRALIRREKWCKNVHIIEQNENKGLANSIITGVTDVIRLHGSAIILEDDVVPSIGFVRYMNNALEIYRNEEEVGCIHAWNYHLETLNYEHSTFFLKGGDCWGWATWERAWNLFNPNGGQLLKQIQISKNIYAFERNGTHPFFNMLKDQSEGKNNSWAIRWHASLFLADKYCLHPTKPIVKNIGIDNSGTHCNGLDYIQIPVDSIDLKKITISESEWFYAVYKQNEIVSKKKWAAIRIYLKQLFLGQ